ncbi:hypothetical protein BDV95DRAFT_599405 [Massariosphaeria phaeospora]|uniref:Rhodopsin domain-containing protein n=1 Tax=Massariosphaeria phaeospora TaxID=100035 RepID=A0A7C8M1Y6_9PLEO|nr:hypothetical protein BDV95DRAFT_599405 [Massariosphaeria phaeospora]
MADGARDAVRTHFNSSIIATYLLMTILVPLRLWCRKRAGGWKNLSLDDALAVAALVLATTHSYLAFFGMSRFAGIHAAELEVADVIRFLQYCFAGQMLYTWGISMVKFSIVAFYWKLFRVTARVPILIVASICAIWLIAFTFVFIFACDPVRASWDITIGPTAKCIDIKTLYVAAAIPNVLTDVLLILLPLPYVWRLHAPIAQRIVLVFVFLLGAFIVVVSGIRLKIFLGIPAATAKDITYNYHDVVLWSEIELNVGVICACLPSLRPLFPILGLGKIFSFNTYAQGDASNKRSSSHGLSGHATHPRKAGAGGTSRLFSTMGRTMTRLDDHASEEFELTGSAQNKLDVEARGHSQDTDRDLRQHGGKLTEEDAKMGIRVQEDWHVSVEDMTHAGRLGD